jgi:hypothetical protein
MRRGSRGHYPAAQYPPYPPPQYPPAQHPPFYYLPDQYFPDRHIPDRWQDDYEFTNEERSSEYGSQSSHHQNREPHRPAQVLTPGRSYGQRHAAHHRGLPPVPITAKGSFRQQALSRRPETETDERPKKKTKNATKTVNSVSAKEFGDLYEEDVRSLLGTFGKVDFGYLLKPSSEVRIDDDDGRELFFIPKTKLTNDQQETETITDVDALLHIPRDLKGKTYREVFDVEYVHVIHKEEKVIDCDALYVEIKTTGHALTLTNWHAKDAGVRAVREKLGIQVDTAVFINGAQTPSDVVGELSKSQQFKDATILYCPSNKIFHVAENRKKKKNV